MNFPFLYRSVESLIIDPSKAWDKIIADNKSTGRINTIYLLPFVFMITISAFLGNILFSHTEVSMLYFAIVSVKCFFLFYFSIYLTAWLSSMLMGAIDLPVSFPDSFRLVVFSAMPLLICQVVSRLFESFIFVNILAFYGLFIFWTGTGKLKMAPQNKRVIMLAGYTILFISTLIAGNWLLTLITDWIYFTLFS